MEARMRLEDKVALVVGAGGGMGTAVPALFAREGARVVLAARRPGPLEDLAEQIKALGGEASRVTGDATTNDGARAIVEETLRRHGRLDVLYCNVGDYAYGDHRAHETTPGEWEYLLSVNLSAAFLCCRAALPTMLGRGGSIILVSATEPVRRGANPGYAAGKAALVALTRNLARQYRADGVRVNCICPGNIGGSRGSEDFQAPPARLDRPAHPADVAYAALYLASDEAAWVTGPALDVDGGLGL